MNSSLALLGMPSTAEWLLLVSKSCVRLFPAPAAVAGNRRATEDIKLDFEIGSAAVIAVPSQKPMLVGWSAASGLQVLSFLSASCELLESALLELVCSRGVVLRNTN